MMKRFAPMLFVPVIAGLMLLASGCSSPLLYKPSCDLEPILTLAHPDHIATLAGCPRDETHVENGVNKHTGNRQPGGIQELFTLTKGDMHYRFILFFSDSAAARWFASDKHVTAPRVPVYREATTNGCSARLRYTEQPRADPEGGSFRMGYYLSRVSFQISNAFISIEVRHKWPYTGQLNLAVKDLEKILREALATTKPPPK